MNARSDLCILLEIRSKSKEPISPLELLYLSRCYSLSLYELFYDEYGMPIGYVIFARLTRDSIIMMNKTKSLPKYQYEWNEGRFLHIIQVLSLRGLTYYRAKSFINRFKLITFYKRDLKFIFKKNNKHHICDFK